MKTTSKLKKRVTLCFSIFLVAFVAALQGVASAAVNMSAYDRMTPMTDNVSAPSDVALDKLGNVYVAETTKDRVVILSQSGHYSGKMITSVIEPISVAVDDNDRIFVGSGSNGSVTVFSPGLGYLFQLGKGNGEFGKPMDIAIDAGGKIYVVDKPNNAILTYNASGTRTGSIGTPGNGPGKLHHPVSIAIDENAQEIVVLDYQQILDPNTNKMIDGARIQYFDMNGVSLRSYSKFGYNNAGMIGIPQPPWMKTIYDISMGQLTRPNQVTVDAMSRIYVTDARLQKVMVYDNHDTWLGTIDSTNSPLRIPQGISIGEASKLYVASLFTSQVEVFGIDDYTGLITAPAVVEFNVVENDAAPPPKAVNVTNLGKKSFSLTTSTKNSWVSTSGSTATLLPTETAFIDIAVNPSGLVPGKYTGSVLVDTGAGAAEVITVVLNVEKNPLQVTPSALEFAATVGNTTKGQALKTSSGAGGNILWNVSADQTWIKLNKANGVTGSSPADTVRVYVDIESLAPGTYNGNVTFVDQLGAYPAIDVTVTLKLSDSTTPPEDQPGTGKGRRKWNKRWTVSQLLPGTSLNGVSGSSQYNVIAVGDNGSIMRYNGKKWARMNGNTATTLNSVWSNTNSSAYAVGANGLVLKYSDTGWSQLAAAGNDSLQDIWGSSDTNIVTAGEFGVIFDSSFTGSADLGIALRSLWGNAEDDMFTAGEAGAVYHSDGTGWTQMNSHTTEWLNSIWSNSSDAFAVGENGAIVHFDGTVWSAMTSGTSHTLNGVCGTSADDVYAVGDGSLVLHYDGSEWSIMDAGAKVDLNDIWCADNGDIFIVGDDGTIIHGKGRFPWARIVQGIAIRAGMDKEKKEKEEEK